jgi:prevent-host-death family protein
MTDVITLTEAKSNFPRIIDRIINKKDKIVITRKGKKVAVVMPTEESEKEEQEGLIKAVGALPIQDETIDRMVELIYEARRTEKSREVNL